jgi:hypothetical protein
VEYALFSLIPVIPPEVKWGSQDTVGEILPVPPLEKGPSKPLFYEAAWNAGDFDE